MAGAAEPGRWPERLAPAAATASPSRALVPVRVPVEPSRWLRLRPPTLARVLALIALGLHALAFGIDAPFGRSIAGGAVLMSVGFGWMAWAWWCFRRAGTPVPPTSM